MSIAVLCGSAVPSAVMLTWTVAASMSERIELLRSRLLPAFRKGIPAKLSVLSHALADHRRGVSSAIQTARRLAHQIRGSAASYGLPALSVAAAAAETADAETIDAALTALIRSLQGAAREDAEQPTRVLLIDDDADFCRWVIESISGEDAAVLPASDSAKARAYLATLSFDCILLDVGLPDEDGRALLADLRPLVDSTVPIVVLTAMTDENLEAECLALGAAQILYKPLEPDLLAVVVSAAVERTRRLLEEARADPLTGLPNRASFEAAFLRHQAVAERTDEPACVALIDLDRFKDVNDTFGHDAGDAVLRRVSEVLSDSLRASDLVARWGGEEFLVLLPSSSLTEATAALNRAREALRSSVIPQLGPGRAVTFSAGVVALEARKPLEDALLKADRRLFGAKRAGRNRVLAATLCDRHRSRILLADDDPLLAKAVRLALGSDYEVTWVPDGAAAIEAMRGTEPFGLVILDGQMPELDGFETLRALRRLDRYRRVPVMMLTSLGDDEHVERAFTDGADDYIEKPFKPRALRARVGRMLDRAGAGKASADLRRTLR